MKTRAVMTGVLWALCAAGYVYLLRFAADIVLIAAGMGLYFLMVAFLPLLALGGLLILGIPLTLLARLLRRQRIAAVGLSLGLALGLWFPLITLEELEFYRHRAIYETQVADCDCGYVVLRPVRYYRPLVYVASPDKLEHIPFCHYDGFVYRRINAHWYICQEDFN